MASRYCLVKPLADIFRQKLKSGEIDPSKLAQMTSQQRHDFFKEFLGEENSKNVNSLFESKLLLKNQMKGMISWAKTVTGIKPAVRQDLVAKINRLEKVLSPENEKAFLSDLAHTRLGIGVSTDEAKKILELGTRAQELRKVKDANWTKENGRAYGTAVQDLMEYIHEINPKDTNLVTNLLNLPRSAVASFDFVSAPLIHSWGLISTKEWANGYRNYFKYIFSEKAAKNAMADILGDPYYDRAVQAGVRIYKNTGTLNDRSEQFMSKLLDKFTLTRASARTYNTFLNKLRFDRWKTLVTSAELMGEDVSPHSKLASDLADVVNNYTGAARLGTFEQATPKLNLAFFSPRKRIATIQMFNPAKYLQMHPVARQAAIRQLFGSMAVTGTVLSMAMMAGLNVELDPRSANFGTIGVGKLRIDVTGGNRTYATLLARLFSGQTKSITTNKISNLGANFGQISRKDVLVNYLRGTLAPGIASMTSDWLWGKDYQGNAFDVKNEVLKSLLPMQIDEAMNVFNADKGNLALSIGLGLLGPRVTVNTPIKTDWSQSTSTELTQFKNKVGDQQFQSANDEYNTKVQQYTDKLVKDSRYIALSDTEKQKVLTKLKTKIKTQVFKEYGFKPKKTRAKTSQTMKDLTTL